MTKDKTLDMARESWIDVFGLGHDRAKFIDALQHFEALVRADEREACAKAADLAEPYQAADLIRSRGEIK
jgi:hypothetical protein